MRDVEDAAATGNERAKLAIKLFYNSILRYVGQYIAEMGGVDGIVFTGGIGENSPETSEAIMKRLAYMGVTINETENKNVERKRSFQGLIRQWLWCGSQPMKNIWSHSMCGVYLRIKIRWGKGLTFLGVFTWQFINKMLKSITDIKKIKVVFCYANKTAKFRLV